MAEKAYVAVIVTRESLPHTISIEMYPLAVLASSYEEAIGKVHQIAARVHRGKEIFVKVNPNAFEDGKLVIADPEFAQIVKAEAMGAT